MARGYGENEPRTNSLAPWVLERVVGTGNPSWAQEAYVKASCGAASQLLPPDNPSPSRGRYAGAAEEVDRATNAADRAYLSSRGSCSPSHEDLHIRTSGRIPCRRSAPHMTR